MFHRKDILEELARKCQNMDEIYDLIHDLQAHNMQFGPYVICIRFCSTKTAGSTMNEGEYSV